MAAAAPTTLPEERTVADEDLDYEAEKPDLPVDGPAVQFPAVAGNAQLEIAQRSADGVQDGRFVKTFIVNRAAPADDDPIHRLNFVGVVQEAIQRGLHPKGQPRLDSAVKHEDGSRRSESSELTYSVDVTPASIDHEPITTVSPNTVNAQQNTTPSEPVVAKPAAKPRRRTAKG